MELFWLWIPGLSSLLLVDILTLPIDQDQWLRPEDVELAEVCEQTPVTAYFRQIYFERMNGILLCVFLHVKLFWLFQSFDAVFLFGFSCFGL